jgi:hypothetical protein
MTEPCIHCKGTGRYVLDRTTRVDIDSGMTVDETYRLCSKCGGTGRVVPATPVIHDEVKALCGAVSGEHVCVRPLGHLGPSHSDGTGTWTDITHPTALTEDEVRGLYDLDSRRSIPHPMECGCDGRGIVPGPEGHAVPCPTTWTKHPASCRCDGKGYLAEPGTSRSRPCPEGRPTPYSTPTCPSTTVFSVPRITEDGDEVSGTRRCTRALGHAGYHTDDVIVWSDHGVTFTEPPVDVVPVGSPIIHNPGVHIDIISIDCGHTIPETGLFPERRCTRIPGHSGLHSDGDLAWRDDGSTIPDDPGGTVLAISAALGRTDDDDESDE